MAVAVGTPLAASGTALGSDRVGPSVTGPDPPRNRTCGFPAYGSSAKSLGHSRVYRPTAGKIAVNAALKLFEARTREDATVGVEAQFA